MGGPTRTAGDLETGDGWRWTRGGCPTHCRRDDAGPVGRACGCGRPRSMAIRAELGGEPSYELAAAEYVRGVTAHHASDADEALAAVEDCLTSPGRSTSRAGRRTRCRSGSSTWPAAAGVATPSPIWSPPRTLSAGPPTRPRAWAHTGLGYAYDVLRLYRAVHPALRDRDRHRGRRARACGVAGDRPVESLPRPICAGRTSSSGSAIRRTQGDWERLASAAHWAGKPKW